MTLLEALDRKDYSKCKPVQLKRPPCLPNEEGSVSLALGIKMQRSDAYAYLRKNRPN